jgi:hypothetical protein
MTVPEQTFWLPTLLVVVVFGVGIWLHLKWHPLKTHFSEGWSMLQSFKWLVPLLAGLHLLSQEKGPWVVPYSPGVEGQVTTWQQILTLFPLSVREVIVLMHGIAPPDVLTLLSPVLFSAAAYRLMRYPYRYGQLRLSKAAKLVLGSGICAALIWVFLGFVSLASVLPEWLVSLRAGGYWLMMAWSMGAFQIFMIRLVINWNTPVKPDDRSDLRLALEQTLAHWRGVLALTVLNLLWVLAWSATADTTQRLSGWVITEAGFIFAVVPVVLAWVKVTWASMAEVMMRVFLNAWLPLLGFVLTASFLLVLVHVSMRGLFSLLPETTAWTATIRILFALVLATVRSWLFLTFVLTLLRHGLKAAASQEAVN